MTDIDDLRKAMHDFIDEGGDVEQLLDTARDVADEREADDIEDDPEDYS